MRSYAALHKQEEHSVLFFVNVNAAPPAQPIRPVRPQYKDVNPDTQSYAGLNADSKNHYKVLMSEYQMSIEQYKKQQKALLNILNFIYSTVAQIYGRISTI